MALRLTEAQVGLLKVDNVNSRTANTPLYITGGSTVYISSASNTSLIMRMGSTEVARVSAKGNFIIGADDVSTTDYKLKVTGATGFAGGHIYLTGANATSASSSTTQIVFGDPGDNHVAISSNSNAVVINPTTSTTTNQIVLDLDEHSLFPTGIKIASTTDSTSTTSGSLITAGGIGVAKNIYSGQKIDAVQGLGVKATTGTGVGISLYSGSTGTSAPTYGLMFAKTASFSTHGGVSGDWATYFTMSDSTTRGWVFRRGSTNIASISGTGYLTLNAGMNLGGNITYNNGSYTDYEMIKFIAGTNDGAGIVIGGGGLAIFGSGESASTVQSKGGASGGALAGGTEYTYITSDGGIDFITNCQNWDTAKKTISINTSGQIVRAAQGTSWWSGRDVALIRQNTSSGYAPILSMKTTNGSWDLGHYNSNSWHDDFLFNYKDDTSYASGADDNTVVHAARLAKNGYLTLANGITANGAATITGTLILSKTTDASGTANNKPALIIGGTDTVAHIEIDANEVMAKGSGTTTATLHLNNDGGLVSIGSGGLSSGGTVYPSTNASYSLGTSSFKWKFLYVNNRVYLDEWIQFSGTTGLYFPSSGAGTHFYPNTTNTYGSFIMQGAKGGYCGIVMGNSSQYMTAMSGTDHQGLYNEANSKWLFYYTRANNYIGIGGTGNSSYGITLHGSVLATGNITSYASDTSDRTIRVTNSNGSVSIHASTNRGLYDHTRGAWIIYSRASDNTTRIPQHLYTDNGYITSSTTMYLSSATSTSLIFRKGTSAHARFDTSGHFIPEATATYNIGNTEKLWSTIHGHHLQLLGTTDATMTAASTNPRITFAEGTGTQPVHLIYTDYNDYRSPAGLKVIGGTSATPAWFEVEGNSYTNGAAYIGGGYVEILKDGEGGTIKIHSKSDTYVYEIDAYNDETIRIHTASKNPNGVTKFISWNGKNGNLNTDGAFSAGGNITSGSSFYANKAGTGQGYIVQSNGTQVARLYQNVRGTAGDGTNTGTAGQIYLMLGNGTAQSTTSGSGAENAYGILRIYGSNTGYTNIRTGTNNTSTYTMYLPGANGQFVYHTNDTQIGSSTVPVYIASTGAATACSSLWTNSSTSSTSEFQVGARSAAGTIYMYAQGTSTANRGLYGANNGGTSVSILTVDKDNNVKLNGAANSATYASYLGNSTNRFYAGYSSGVLISAQRSGVTRWAVERAGENQWLTAHFYDTAGTWLAGKRIWMQGDAITGAVWNDYAEYRESDCIEPGYVLSENGDDTLSKTQKRLSHFAGISSDTWGFCQGETNRAKTPIAVAGRVLVYTYRNRCEYEPGDCVCAAPDGTVDIMTREEIIQYPDRIVGTVSCVPNYDTWGSGDRDPVKVNGRIWIKVI